MQGACRNIHSLGAKALALNVLVVVTLGDAASASVADIRDQTNWGESSMALARRFGARATVLARPIEFGDSYVDVVLRDEPIAGHPFIVYFQMGKQGRGLKRIQFERPRHGANLGVFRAVIAELESAFGKPQQSCRLPPRAAEGYQAAATYLWSVGDDVVRATFRDTTLGAIEDCLDDRTPGRCGGPTAQLFVQIRSDASGVDDCR